MLVVEGGKALNDIMSERRGFRAGIDDYRTKLVDLDELVLRALVHRDLPPCESVVTPFRKLRGRFRWL